MSIGACAAQPWGSEPPLDLNSAVAKLTGLLNDDSATVRSSAETAVARLAAKAPMAPPAAMVEGATAWPSKESRRSAALVLGVFKKDLGPAVAALTKAVEDKEPEVRSDAAVALRTIGLDAAPALPALVKNLGDPFVPPPAPPSMMGTLPPGGGGGGPGGTPEPTDPPTQAARAIGRIASAQFQQSKTAPTADVVEALIKATGADREELRAAALDALRRIGKGASAAVPALAQALADSAAKPGSRPTIAGLLADIAPGTDRANDAIAALTAALDSTDVETRMAAVTALGRFGPAAVAVLPKLQAIAEARKDDAQASTDIKLAIDRVEGKVPPEAPRRKGQRRGR
jgi:HEAT repeat protein